MSYRSLDGKEKSGELRVIYDARVVAINMAQNNFHTPFGEGILCDCVTCNRSIWMRPEIDLRINGDTIPDAEVHRVFSQHGWGIHGFETHTQCPRCRDERPDPAAWFEQKAAQEAAKEAGVQS